MVFIQSRNYYNIHTHTHTHTLSNQLIAGGAGAYPSVHWAEGRKHPGQAAITRQTYRQIHSHTHSPRSGLASSVRLTACLWTVGGNPHRHGENMQTPHRKDLVARGIEPRPFLL